MHPVHNCRHIKLCPKQSWQTVHCLAIHLYYYSSPVRKNLSSKFDENLPERSQFDSDHRVHFSAPTSCQSATFVRPLFAFVLCFLRQQNHQKKTNEMKAYRSEYSIKCAARTMIPTLYSRLVARWRHGFLL